MYVKMDTKNMIMKMYKVCELILLMFMYIYIYMKIKMNIYMKMNVNMNMYKVRAHVRADVYTWK